MYGSPGPLDTYSQPSYSYPKDTLLLLVGRLVLTTSNLRGKIRLNERWLLVPSADVPAVLLRCLVASIHKPAD